MSVTALFFGGRTPSGQPPAHAPNIPRSLQRLFKQVPKTELHLHLSGSAPIGLIRQFLREQGWPEDKIAQETQIKDMFESLNDFLYSTYYKIPAHIKTPEHFRRSTVAIIKEAAQENVRHLEIRTSILKKGGTPQEIVEAVEAGIREGQAWVQQHKGYVMQAGVIILAQRGGSPADSLESAKLAVDLAKRKSSLIRGFDLAGSETDHAVDKHADAIKYFVKHGKPLGLGLTIHAGETPDSEGGSGVDSIKKAIALGADRIGHGLQLQQDQALRDTFTKRQIPIELCPWSNVQLKSVTDYPSHPIQQFLKDKLNISLSTDNRMVSKINLTQQLGQLYQHGLLTRWDEIKQVLLNGARGAFLPAMAKKRLEREMKQELQRIEQHPRHQKTIGRYLTPAEQLVRKKK